MPLSRPFLQRILRSIARIACGHPRMIVLGCFLLTCATGYLAAFHLGVLNNTNDLIREGSPVLEDFKAYQQEFQTKDPIILIIESPDFRRNQQAVVAMAEKLQPHLQSGALLNVYYRNDFSKLERHALLHETPENLNKILNQIRTQSQLLSGKSKPNEPINLNALLSEGLKLFYNLEEERGDEGTIDALESYADRMVRDLEALADELKPIDPDASTVPAIKVPALSEAEKFQQELEKNSYLSFEDGKLLLIVITPGKGDQTSFSPYEKLIRTIRGDMEIVRKQFTDVSIGLTGEPVLLYDELEQSTKDMVIASLIAFSLIALLFFVAYREITRPSLALIALVCALVWSLGFTVIVVGHLNIISQAFVLMLLGLGIDFGIQILGRYEEERVKGIPVAGAIENALQYTGIALVTGGGTTAVAFFTMCFNEFTGLAELGLIAGSGIIFCMVANLLLLPALLAWIDGRRPDAVPEHHKHDAEKGARLDALIFSHPKLILGTAALLTTAAIWQATRVRFDYNVLNLQNQNLESVKLVEHILQSSAQDFLFGVVVAENWDDAKSKTESLMKLPTVKEVVSPLRMIPERQEEKLAILSQIKTELKALNFNPDVTSTVDVKQAKRDLRKLLRFSREGYEEAYKYRNARDPRARQALEVFRRLIPALESSLASLESLSQAEAGERLNRFQVQLLKTIKEEFDFLCSFDMENPITVEMIPPEMARRYVSSSGKILLEVMPKENVWNRDACERFVRDLQTVSPRATGTPVINYVYLRLLRDSYIQAGWMAFVAIVIMVGIHFRSITRLVLAILPLLLGFAWTLATMALFSIPFNPANIITLPLVIGIGVAYGVYIIDRHTEEGHFSLFASSTGKAIALSALTTIFGFAAMMTGQYQGLASLGLVMSIGILYCFLAATYVMPQILKLTDGMNKPAHSP